MQNPCDHNQFDSIQFLKEFGGIRIMRAALHHLDPDYKTTDLDELLDQEVSLLYQAAEAAVLSQAWDYSNFVQLYPGTRFIFADVEQRKEQYLSSKFEAPMFCSIDSAVSALLDDALQTSIQIHTALLSSGASSDLDSVLLSELDSVLHSVTNDVMRQTFLSKAAYRFCYRVEGGTGYFSAPNRDALSSSPRHHQGDFQ